MSKHYDTARRVKEAVKIYPFLDEVSLEETFSFIDTAFKKKSEEEWEEDLVWFAPEVTTMLVNAQDWSMSEAKGMVTLWLKLCCDKDEGAWVGNSKHPEIGGKTFETMVIVPSLQVWGKGKDLSSAQRKVEVSASELISFCDVYHEVWVVSEHTILTGDGRWNFSADGFNPIQIF